MTAHSKGKICSHTVGVPVGRLLFARNKGPALLQGYCGMEGLPLPVGRLDSVMDVSTAVSNALNPGALRAGGGETDASSIVMQAAPLLGPQVCGVALHAGRRLCCR